MTSTTTEPVATQTADEPQQPKIGARVAARARLLRKGASTTRATYRDWRRAQTFVELRAAALADRDPKSTAWWETQRRKAVAENRQTTSNVIRVAAVALTGGWWPSLLAALAMLAYAWHQKGDAKTDETREAHASAVRAGWSCLLVSGTLLSISAAIDGAVTTGPSWFNITAGVLVSLGLVAAYISAIWDGDAGNDLPTTHVEPPQVDEIKPDIETPGGVVAALARPLKITKAVDIQGAFVVVGGGLVWDAARRWKSVTIQMSGRTVMDVQDERTLAAIAGNLRIPTDWLITDVGTNASQVVMHMAEEPPWPTVPTPAPILASLTGDVWRPQRIGLDLLGSTPVEVTLASSSIAVGGNTGTGKTALERLLGFLVLADLYAVLDVWDFKGDGALSMFEAHAGTYGSGYVEDIGADFLAYLQGLLRDLVARQKLLARIAETNRADVRDAKVTRDLTRKHRQLRPRFVMVDEFQDALTHEEHGPAILKLLIEIARKGRSAGIWLILATQNWDTVTVPMQLAKVLPTKLSLRMPTYATSAQILGGKACKYRSDLLPHVPGAAIIHPSGDGAAVKATVRVLLDYADALDTEEALTRLAEHRGEPARPVVLPPCPPVLDAMHGLVAAGGRMRSVELAEALAGRGLLPALSPELDARGRAQQLADMVRPLGVRPRPDRAHQASPNAPTYWMSKIDSRGNQVGVGPAREAFGLVAPGGSGGDS